MWQDPIVKEVRQIRQEIEAECDGDFEKIFALAKDVQNKFKSKLVSRPSHTKEKVEALSIPNKD